MQPAEIRLDVDWGELSALAWPRPNRPRALCLHGWMDNAASFLPLSPLLEELDLVALEFAGHGHSDHRPRGAHYYYTDYLYDLDRALDAMGWESCGIIGHSLGAGIGSALACAAPERVDWLVMIDGLGALAEAPAKVSGRIRKSLQSVREPRRHKRTYKSIKDAARVRKTNNPMQESSARLLAERALTARDAGFHWRTDGRLMWTSPALLTDAQACELLAAIGCPVLALTTDMLVKYMGDNLQARLDAIANLDHRTVAGDHHMHMDNPEIVARAIRAFLQNLGETSDQ